MPLLSGSSKKVIGENIGTLMGEIGKSPHVKSRKQAIAIAFSKAGKSKKKDAKIEAMKKRKGGK
jgi:hypothetical protein